MLSKIKSSTVAESRSSIRQTSNASENTEDSNGSSSNISSSETPETQTTTNNNNDSNNNNNVNFNNNQQGKKSKDELLDIVEVSRKRRLSKDSADSLTGFIRWSFSHINPSLQRLVAEAANSNSNNNNNNNNTSKQQNNNNNNNNNNNQETDKSDNLESGEQHLDEEMLHDENGDREVDWASLMRQQQQLVAAAAEANRFQVPAEQLLRQHANKFAGASSGGANSVAASLALLAAKANERNLSSFGGNESGARPGKRPRARDYSPESKYSNSALGNLSGGGGSSGPHSLTGSSALLSGARKSSNYLGNVVDRLHQQQQQLHHQQSTVANLVGLVGQQSDIDSHAGNNEAQSNTAGLSFHLQQFLQQQTSLEDLCSSVGLDEGNQQLVLAAAIHRALVDSAGGQQQLAGGGAGALGANTTAAETKSTGASSTGSSSASGSNNSNNTPTNLSSQVSAAAAAAAALQGLPGANLHLVNDALNHQRRAYNTRAALHGLTAGSGTAANQHRPPSGLAMNMTTRVQQQRHAQAAAALSALASAGSHQALSHLATHGTVNTNGALSLAALGATPTTPIVDFRCDTCPSSFDDRHRLMQHQSIHLELKKDWFTETPVDEVMKIFNRRRGEFLCNICNLRFEATLDYDQHNHSVHGPRPYCCQFCGNGTRTFKCWRQYLNHLYDHRFHLNCQLPQNQQHPLRVGHNLMVGAHGGASGGSGTDSKWLGLDDEDDHDGRHEDDDEDDEDTENEMNVAD